MTTELAKIMIDVHGPFAFHNFPCPTCRERHAVLDLSCGIMKPCWTCQSRGWTTKRHGRLVRWWRNENKRPAKESQP